LIRYVIAPSQSGDRGSERLSASLRHTALLFVGIGGAWTIATVLVLRTSVLVTLAAAVISATLVASLVLVGTGRRRLGGVMLVIGLWMGSTVAAALMGGVSAPTVQAYTVVILGAGLLVGRRASLGMAALCALAAAGLALLETIGALPMPIAHSPWKTWWVELSIFTAVGFLLFDAAGRVQRAIAGAVESEERAHRLFEQGADAIFVLGRGRLLDANRQACELTGYTREELLTLGVRDIFAEPKPGTFRQDLEILGSGETMSEQRTLLIKGGSTRLIEGNSRLLSDGRIEVFARDVTERVAAQRKGGQLQVALDEAKEGIVVLDANERLVYANPSFQGLYEGSVNFNGQPSLEQLLSEARRSELVAKIRSDVVSGKAFSDRYQGRLRSGEPVVRDTSWAPIRGASGEFLGFVGVVRDVTREVELEASLRHAHKMEAVGQLAAGVAHDFNNLLTAILGFAELLRPSVQGEPAASEALAQIGQAARQAANLTAQLLAFGRRQPVQPEVLDLNDVVRETAGILHRLVREDVELELALDPVLPCIQADRNQIRQLLLNLVTNARDATPRGGRIEIRTDERVVSGEAHAGSVAARKGRYAMLSVTDTGEGMDAETREHIFEPFFTTKAVGQGTGLGLASVHGIVEQNGGVIEVESAPGRGATFRILLPASTQVATAPPRTAPKAAAVTTPGTVLVVEDQDRVRDVVVRVLRDAGYHVLEASDGESTLRLVDRLHAIDVLLTDIVMPKLDGRSLAARLRERWPDLRVLFTSGYAEDTDRAWLASDENATFLPKPFTPRELLEAVQKMVGASRTGTA
jgi:PAS domain S-box-containing protein